MHEKHKASLCVNVLVSGVALVSQVSKEEMTEGAFALTEAPAVLLHDRHASMM